MSDAFLTNADGSIPANPEALPATRVGQYAKNAVDAETRALLVKPVAADPDTTPAATFLGFNKTVAATGAPERLHSVQGERTADQIIVSPLRTNTGNVFLGTASTNDTQHIEAPFIFAAPDGKKIDAYDIYVDVTVNGEGVRATLIN